MLKLTNIVKDYVSGDTTVEALKGVSLTFRKSEFVSILGQSGCGKTTMLNIIGGLDRYTSGDLEINGVSTKNFSDSDWDAYRNHSIGFVFQNYNLIPHQTVLSNVELALTLSGVSKDERRRRATEALQKVGLGDQLHKKPNQMSGGQMQRVAIARALVNDPDILLADEPTGALDSETSVQIMELLKEISADKLIIMVTHNPELAKRYSTRIIRLLDGNVIDDSDPFEAEPEEKAEEPEQKKKRKKSKDKKNKTSMSFFTAVSLSFNNLLTKKGRTFLTAFAGSIGIIGIALILAMSSGVTGFIDSVQQDMMSSYPISISAKSVDTATLLTTLMEEQNRKADHKKDAVYANPIMYDLVNKINDKASQTNNLKPFKEFLDKESNEKTSTTDLYKYATSIQYSYDLDLSIYTKDKDGKIIKSDANTLMAEMTKAANSKGSSSQDTKTSQAVNGDAQSSGGMSSMMSGMGGGINIWEEMLSGKNDSTVSKLLDKQYDVLYGSWPKNYDEIVLVLDENNEVSDMCLYALGLETADELKTAMKDSAEGKKVKANKNRWSYKDICDMTFRLVLPSDCYKYNAQNGTYSNISETDAGLQYLYDNGLKLKISGIVRPNEDATASMMKGSIGYTAALTKYVVKRTNESDIVKAQKADEGKDILTGKTFKPDDGTFTDTDKANQFKSYAASLSEGEKAALYKMMAVTPTTSYLNETSQSQLSAMTREQKQAAILASLTQQMNMDEATVNKYLSEMDDASLDEAVLKALKEQIKMQYAQQVNPQIEALTTEEAAVMLDSAIGEYDEATLASMYDTLSDSIYSDSTYDDNLKLLGSVDLANPSTVNIYTDTFEDKDSIADIISGYNKKAAEDDKITYTDYVELLMSSVTMVINAISYVLIAFVSISLVVSSIMIGIITYISVLERTKEIGILRAIGASKRDISSVFNAETLMIGFTAGAIGIGISVLLCLPINAIIHSVSGINTINASLPVVGAVILVAISMFLTFIAGLIPSRIAAKKDPVVALRSE